MFFRWNLSVESHLSIPIKYNHFYFIPRRLLYIYLFTFCTVLSLLHVILFLQPFPLSLNSLPQDMHAGLRRVRPRGAGHLLGRHAVRPGLQAGPEPRGGDPVLRGGRLRRNGAGRPPRARRNVFLCEAPLQRNGTRRRGLFREGADLRGESGLLLQEEYALEVQVRPGDSPPGRSRPRAQVVRRHHGRVETKALQG